MSRGTVFLMGHGAVADGEHARVPAGTRLHLYALAGENLAWPVGLAAVSTAGASGALTVVTGSGDEAIMCPNVTLGPLSPSDVEQARAIAPSGVRLVLAGEQGDTGVRPLCDQPDVCGSAAGEHRCTGWFGVLADATDLHLLACLSAADPGAPLTVVTGEERYWTDRGEVGTATLVEELEEIAEDFAKLPDEQKVITYYSWPTATRALMRGIGSIDEWAVALHGCEAYDRDGPFGLLRHVRGLDPRQRPAAFNVVGLEAVVRWAEEWISQWRSGTAGPEDAARRWATLGERDRLALAETDPEVHEVVRAWARAFPDGVEAETVRLIADAHNRAVLAELVDLSDFTDDETIDCVVGDGIAVLAPKLLEDRDDEAVNAQAAGVLRRWCAGHPVFPDGVVITVPDDEQPELTGLAVEAARPYWAELAAGGPLLMMPIRRRTLGLAELTSFADTTIPEACNAAVRTLVADYNAVAAAGESGSAALRAARRKLRAAVRERDELVHELADRLTRVFNQTVEYYLAAQPFGELCRAALHGVELGADLALVLPGLAEYRFLKLPSPLTAAEAKEWPALAEHVTGTGEFLVAPEDGRDDLLDPARQGEKPGARLAELVHGMEVYEEVVGGRVHAFQIFAQEMAERFETALDDGEQLLSELDA
ncbi:hypothetical protein UK23_14745 [Lentzea aerocolonigenes]|uniref:Putative adhesin Stv domain-containing protein n=1 Tax=Lentzea aerocolonigenes TaxID=68170 RepID=A0A0F0H0Y7_LENAE|nr:hypothetical protein [Lentzea aerocolonigenes]KJK49235.1 hypothetical protein UK23_14745 [Lentzea aerocolonigenes]